MSWLVSRESWVVSRTLSFLFLLWPPIDRWGRHQTVRIALHKCGHTCPFAHLPSAHCHNCRCVLLHAMSRLETINLQSICADSCRSTVCTHTDMEQRKGEELIEGENKYDFDFLLSMALKAVFYFSLDLLEEIYLSWNCLTQLNENHGKKYCPLCQWLNEETR